MGVSPSHRFGQIVGEVLEWAVEPIVAAQAAKLSWLDVNGNLHDLDFVLERGGTDTVQGAPAAFIEVAWRRYTKHSRAKAQEIQGAIMPLLQQHHLAAPFIGVVIAGVFTEPALQQLRSLGFSVLFIPTSSIVNAFAKVGINAVADAGTPDSEYQRQVNRYESLSLKRKRSIAAALLDGHEKDVEAFSESMDKVLSRQVERIIVLPLHGKAVEFATIEDAVESLQGFDEGTGSGDFVRYEIEVRYNNGNTLRGSFSDKASAVEFLFAYKPNPYPVLTAESDENS